MHFFYHVLRWFLQRDFVFLVGFTFMYFLAYVLQAQWDYVHFGIAFSRMHLRNFNVFKPVNLEFLSYSIKI